MTPVPVLFVNHVGACGGAEESLLGLIEHLDRDRYVPHLALPSGGTLAERADAAGAHLHHISVPRLRRRDPVHVKLLRVAELSEARGECTRLMRVIRPALVHANSNVAQLVAGGPAARARVPAIWHSRDLVPLGLIGRRMARRATRVLAVSEAVAQNLRKSAGPAAKVSVLYNGIDPERVCARLPAAAVRRSLGVAEGSRLLLSVGQLVPWKRHDQAIRCLVGLERTTLAICGSDQFGDHPNAEAELRAIAENEGVGDRVLFLGQRADVPELLNAADVILHPAEREPFGRVVVEAMLAGRPVVATAAAGPAEILRDGETGVLVPAGDATGFAAAVHTLAGDSVRRARIGSAARRDALARFTLDTCIDRVQQLYAELLGTG